MAHQLFATAAVRSQISSHHLPAGAAGARPSPGMAGRVVVAALLASALAAALGGCAEEEPAAAVTVLPQRKTQQNLSLTCANATAVCWPNELASDAGLKAQVDAIGQPVQAAGELADAAGNRLVWAELAASATAPRTEVSAAWSLCNKAKVCTAGKAVYTATGAAFTDASGKALAKLEIGEPAMRKTINFMNKEDDTTVLGALKQPSPTYKIDADVARAQLQLVQFGKRRLVVLNAFGPQVGLDAAPVVSAAKASGLYDSVELIDYVRKSDVMALLPTLTGIDTVVWLGAGVVETGSPSKLRPLGLTVSRGVFGDQLVYGVQVGDLLTAPALGGPGLIVLAGSQVMPGPTEEASLKILAGKLGDPPARAVVGFTGKVTAAQALAAVNALLGKLAGGATLTAALAAAGQPMTATLDAATQKTWKMQGKRSAFWGGKNPSKAAMTLHVRMEPPRCTHAIEPCNLASYNESYGASGGQIPSGELTAGHASFVCQGLVFDGPWFSCSAKDANTSADFVIQGVMKGRNKDDRFWVAVDGTANLKFKQVFAVAEGVIEELDTGGGRTAMRFKGPALSSPYRDDENRCCTPGGPYLATIKNEPGFFEIWP